MGLSALFHGRREGWREAPANPPGIPRGSTPAAPRLTTNTTLCEGWHVWVCVLRVADKNEILSSISARSGRLADAVAAGHFHALSTC